MMSRATSKLHLEGKTKVRATTTDKSDYKAYERHLFLTLLSSGGKLLFYQILKLLQWSVCLL